MFLCIISTTATTFQSCSVSSMVLDSNNVAPIAKSILNVLTSKLNISSLQSGAVSTALTTFLGSKANIMGLAKSDPTAYLTQLAGTQSNLTSSLKNVLDVNQMARLTGLKPATNDPKNVLSQLFF